MPSSAFGLPVRSANRYEAPPAMTLLTTLTASQSATIVYTGFDSSLYKIYFLLFRGLVPNDGSNTLSMYGSTDRGASYGTLWYNNFTRNDGSSTLSGAGGATAGVPTQNLVIGDNVSTTSFPASVNGTGYLSFGLPGTDDTSWSSNLQGYNNDRPSFRDIKAFYRSLAPVNTLKWFFDTGTIKRGSILIFGVGG